jgi:DNA-directed RNA polymerase beta' subunit
MTKKKRKIKLRVGDNIYKATVGKKTKKKKSEEKRGVRLAPLNWDDECKIDFASNKGFRITEPAIKGQVKLYNGIQSERFGSDFDSEEGFRERYRCTCGQTVGKIYEGIRCSKCNTPVQFRDTDLSITGWIIIDNYHIIHPVFYIKLEGIIGKDLINIITYDKVMNRDGILEEKESDIPFYGIGIMEFKDRLEEILEYYGRKKKNKSEEIQEILENKDIIFPHSIPVYSSILRPMSFKGESLFYGVIDKTYNKIFASVRLLNDIDIYESKLKSLAKKDRERMDKNKILSRIQADLMELWELVFEQVDGKTGQIQGEILGGMLNFSSRDVIIPDPDLKADEIKLNYHSFLELFKFEIIAQIVAINKVSYPEAIHQWEIAKINFNQKIYEIMNYIVKKQKCYVIIIRNPTKILVFYVVMHIRFLFNCGDALVRF